MSRSRVRTLGRRLSYWLALQSLFGLLIVCGAIYAATSYAFKNHQIEELNKKKALIGHFASEARNSSDEAMLRHKLSDFMVGHSDFGLSVRSSEGAAFFEVLLPTTTSPRRAIQFDLVSPVAAHRPFQVELTLDTAKDVLLLRRIALALALAASGGVFLISLGGFVLVRLGLRPLRELSIQINALAADSLHRRVDGSNQPGELAPLIVQFNDLLGRLEASYEQLEGFNADVAHELLTPLATLTSGAELALSSSKDIGELREALGSSLEDLQRIAGIVHDMLFLSQADRGAVARRVESGSLAALARRVADYHDAALADAGLSLEVVGDAAGAFDVSLLQRALSNLISNASRYATRGTSVRVVIQLLSPDEVLLQVQNQGITIDSKVLPRMFDRFFRADSSRCQADRNHGLGLSIVAAIARMHGGRPTASSSGGITAIGMVVMRFGPGTD
jgi:two-component system, OmpR family, heavy metal sensor histidine kinase CusS